MKEKKELTLSPVVYISTMFFALIWALIASNVFFYCVGLGAFFVFTTVVFNKSPQEVRELFKKNMKD